MDDALLNNRKVQLFNLIKVIELSKIKISYIPEDPVLGPGSNKRIYIVCSAFASLSSFDFSKWALTICFHLLELITV